MIKTDHNLINCPQCGDAINASTSVDADAEPQPGDIAICNDCATVLRFTAAGELLGLRVVSDEEWRAFAAACPEKARVVKIARKAILGGPVDAEIAALVKAGDILWKQLRKRFPLPHATAVVLDIVMECAHDMAREQPMMRENFTAELMEGINVAFEHRRLN